MGERRCRTLFRKQRFAGTFGTEKTRDFETLQL